MKYISIIGLFFLTACATVGPVEITEDDTIVTVSIAFILAAAVFFLKGYVDYFFAKKLEKYKKELHDNLSCDKGKSNEQG